VGLVLQLSRRPLPDAITTSATDSSSLPETNPPSTTAPVVVTSGAPGLSISEGSALSAASRGSIDDVGGVTATLQGSSFFGTELSQVEGSPLEPATDGGVCGDQVATELDGAGDGYDQQNCELSSSNNTPSKAGPSRRNMIIKHTKQLVA